MAPKPEVWTMASFCTNRNDKNTSITKTPCSRVRQPQSLCCKLEHSFSQSELSHFSRHHNKPSHITDLESDFVHLHSIKVHSKGINYRDESKEGIQFRSLRASRDKSSKVVVVVPSIDLDRNELKRMCDCIQNYEERALYHLLMSNDPLVRIIYLSSNRVSERVVGYYLGLCGNKMDSGLHPLCDTHQMLSRVLMIHVPSDECIPLSEKILKQRNLIGFLKDVINGPFNGCEMEGINNEFVGLTVFTGSDSIDLLSEQLGIRLLEASGHQLHWGTKQGSREIFAACGLTFPRGTPDLPDDDDLLSFGNKHGDKHANWAQNHRYIRSARQLSIGIARQISKGVRPKKWMVKLNQGFSGKGNASVDLRHIQNRQLSIPEMTIAIEKELEATMKFEDAALTWHGDDKNVGFKTQIERLGVIAEAFIEGEVPTSPSIQAVIAQNCESEEGRVSLISTHEQLLDGQTYNGCINPASEKYREQIMDMGLKVGKYMAERGVLGHFSVDFLANQSQDGSWELNAVEVNLRQGGTTHPHAALALLCGGCICSSDGLFRTNDGEVRTYIATDTYVHPNLKGLNESQVIDAIECRTNALANKIRWSKGLGIGVVFHLFRFIEKYGRIGFTSIGRNREEAQTLYDTTLQFLENVGNRTGVQTNNN